MALMLQSKEYAALHVNGKTYEGVWLNGKFYPFGSGVYYLVPGTEEDTDESGHPIKLSRKKSPLLGEGTNLQNLKGITQQDCVFYCPVAKFLMPSNGDALGVQIQDDQHYMWINLGAIAPQSVLALPLSNGQTAHIRFL